VNLEEQLRTYGDEVERLATDRAPDAHRDGVQGSSDVPVIGVATVPNRRRRPLLLVAGAAAAIALVVAAVFVATGREGEVSVVDAGPTGTDAPATTERATSTTVDDPSRPPAEPDSPISLWLSADRVPPGPIEVVASVVDHGGTDVSFGVGAVVERWSGTAWQVVGGMSMCLDHWYCTATVQPGNGMVGVEDIGLGASPGRPGAAERFTLDGLEPGWYRISHAADDGQVAAGIIEVTTDAPAPAPLAPVNGPAISMQPVLTPEGGTTVITPLLQGVSGTDLATIEARQSEDATIERWQDRTWVPAATVPLEPAADAGIGARTLRVPALVEGEYRVVRTGPDGEHVGRFWVADLEQGRTDPPQDDDPSRPRPVSPPTLTIDPAGPYTDQQDVTVSGSGFEPGLPIMGQIGQCPVRLDTAVEERCGYAPVITPLRVADDGTFTMTFELRVWTPFRADCRVAPGCVLAWVPPKRSMEAAIPLEFAPG
jgi:hypothetical protein